MVLRWGVGGIAGQFAHNEGFPETARLGYGGVLEKTKLTFR
jgi:hypothetical protein